MKDVKLILLAVLVVLAGAGVYLLNGINTSLQREADESCTYPTNTLALTYDETGASYEEAQEKFHAAKKKTLDILSGSGVTIKSSADTVRFDVSHDVTAEPDSKASSYRVEGLVDIEMEPNEKIFDVLKTLGENDIDASLNTSSASNDCAAAKNEQTPSKKD